MQIIWFIVEVLGLLISYYVLRQFFTTPQKRKSLLIFYLIITPLAIVAGLFGRYMYNRGKSESFNRGIELLKNDKKVLDQIGRFESYTVITDSLPKETDNPAKFKVTLNGTDGSIYLECVMQKDEGNTWFLKELKEDSLIKK